MLSKTGRLFHLYGSEAEVKRPDIITNDVLTALMSQEVPRILEAWSQKLWPKTGCI